MWSYSHDLGSELRLRFSGQEYFRYHFATDRDRPYGHPVTLAQPGAEPLTCHAPHDHLWHAGCWFSWKYLDGVNYWENAANGHPEGRLALQGQERVEASGDRLALQATYAYLDPRRGTVASEVRRTTWHRPDPDGGHRLDYDVSLTPVAALVLDRTPITAQTPWGGYAGLSWRFARGLGAVDGLDAEGRRHRAIEHQRARWAALHGALDGGPAQLAGVAMFDHPANPRHPTPWRYIADPGFAYLNPSPLLAEPLRLQAGETLGLRYRVLVFPGPADPSRLEAEWARYAAEGA